ncbi:MAG: fibronectin type III domain-containing protein [Spirochaetales bacterium]|nr:fibronectin type III domain-containing protein [Spirochaetales bacterium]
MKNNVKILSGVLLLLIFLLSACENDLIAQVESIRTAASSPVMTLTLADSSTAVSGTRVDCGQVSVGSICDILIAINNIGQSRLDIDLANIDIKMDSGTEDGTFSIIALPSEQIDRAESSDLTLRFSPVSGGDKSATVSIPSNDFNNPLFTFTVGGSGWAVVLTTDTVSNISTTTATGGGNITNDGGISIIRKGICWSTSPNPTTNDNFAVNAGVGIGTSSDLITGLSPGTLYYVRAYASNSVTTGYGSQVSFTTLPVAPAALSVSTVGYPVGSGQLSVSWTAVSGTSIYYDVYVDDVNTIPGTPAVTNLSSTSYTLEELVNYIEYYVWVVAKNATGESSPSASEPCMVGVKVLSISFNKTTGIFLPESSETLTVTITPENATQPGLTWGTDDSNIATVSTATITGGTSTGTTTITATALDGCGAYKQFSATNKLFVKNTQGPAGGILFYDKGSYLDGWRYLEAAPVSWSDPFDYPAPWIIGGATQTTLNGNTLTALGTGLNNSNAIIAQTGHTGSAAAVCRAYTGGDKTDWYLPSIEEIHQMYLENAYIELAGVYWSSSEADANNAWTKTIFSGYQTGSYGKGAAIGQVGGPPYDYRVRPIRAF